MILLIGATSFLGPPVLARLLKGGHEVGCMLRNGSNRENLVQTARNAGKEISFSSGNLLSPDSMIDSLDSAATAVYMIDLVKYAHLLPFLIYALAHMVILII